VASPERHQSALLAFWQIWFCDWRNLLLIVKPETVLGWQRASWKAYWMWRSSRPAIQAEPQAVIGARLPKIAFGFKSASKPNRPDLKS
jgi:hypothetical protein